MRFLETFFNGQVILNYLPDLVHAMGVTLGLAAATIVTGILCGAALACLRVAGLKVVNFFIIVFADIMRALPPLVLIMILFFGMSSLGLNLSGWTVIYIVLSLVLAAFSEEIFWGGLTSIPAGQWEAGRATGLSRAQTLFHITFPQAARRGIPPLVNRVLATTKLTALGSVIGVKEILSVSSSAQSFSGSATPLTMAAIAYLIIFIPAVILSHWIERRYHFAT
ncbi:amino acid ABC transporter permease [Pseudooceanicola sp. CBS1P-1]|uniref:ABC transporter permease subunit n=1 Tax=Pseudooceanicola albus TaxID=2692189 RepID=A0A6L7GCR3_9RHOB|nr:MULTISPECIES: amino acid ABC transporter permease [Pseudooceanicola]MBT9386951.1 amino acid ABC transporter permease [Pseudooceanicola endophyticus]MXN21076.1 ABC transporter permease subunit [Pseudooceanicola albus]